MSTILLHTSCLSANLECRSEMCFTRLAGNTGRKNEAKNRRLRTIAGLCPAVSSQRRRVSIIRKQQQEHQTCPATLRPAIWRPQPFHAHRLPLVPSALMLLCILDSLGVLLALCHSAACVSFQAAEQRVIEATLLTCAPQQHWLMDSRCHTVQIGSLRDSVK